VTSDAVIAYSAQILTRIYNCTRSDNNWHINYHFDQNLCTSGIGGASACLHQLNSVFDLPHCLTEVGLGALLR